MNDEAMQALQEALELLANETVTKQRASEMIIYTPSHISTMCKDGRLTEVRLHGRVFVTLASVESQVDIAIAKREAKLLNIQKKQNKLRLQEVELTNAMD